MPGVLLVFGTALRAHDIPNARVDRSIQLDAAGSRLRIAYEVSLSELTLTQDLRALIGELPGTDRPAWFQKYGEVSGLLNARGILVKAGGSELPLRVDGFQVVVDQHPRFLFRFSTDLPESGRVLVRDTNYAASEGTSRLALRGGADVVLDTDDLSADVESIPIRPVWQLTDEEERRTREIEFGFRFRKESTSVPATVETRPPVAEPARSLTGLLDAPGDGLLRRLLLGGAALLMGAAHSLQPGHGKTLAAAGSVGSAHPWRSAALMGGSTALAHLITVVLIAGVLWWSGGSDFAALHRPLTRVAGFLIAAAGMWRLGRIAGGIRTNETDDGRLKHRSTLGLIGLGAAAGLVPCWEGIGLLVLASSIGRLGLGLYLLIWFSVGMGAVLILAAGLSARLTAGRSRVSASVRIAGALILVGVGGWFLAASG